MNFSKIILAPKQPIVHSEFNKGCFKKVQKMQGGLLQFLKFCSQNFSKWMLFELLYFKTRSNLTWAQTGPLGLPKGRL